jgi:hypothetical protein
MASIYQYINADLVLDVTQEVVDPKFVIQAEKDIEAVLPVTFSTLETGSNLYSMDDPHNKALGRRYCIPKGNVAFTDNTLTIPIQGNGEQNMFQYTVIEILEKDLLNGTVKVSQKIPVQSSQTVGVNTILSFEAIAGLAGTVVDVDIYQPGKMPFVCDYSNGHKRLNSGVCEAIAWQAAFLKGQTKTTLDKAINTSSQDIDSESIGENYNYKNRTGKNISTIKERISPKARDALVAVFGYYPPEGVEGM